MRLVYQTPGDNQCLRCCVATLFDLPVEDVPFFGGALAFNDDAGFGSLQERELRAWLRERGLDYVETAKFRELIEDEAEWRWYSHEVPHGYSIAVGPTERGTYHAVVWAAPLWNECTTDEQYEAWERTGVPGRMVHDPHPSGVGLLYVERFKQIIVINPARLTQSNLRCKR